MKKVLAIFVSIILLLCSCASNTQETTTSAATTEAVRVTTEAFDLSSYKEAVSLFREDVNAAATVLSNMGNYEYNYLDSLKSISGRFETENVSSKAFDWLEKKSDESQETVEAANSSIKEQYKELILIEISGKEAEEIDAEVRALYDAYAALYSLVVDFSSSSLNSFVDDFNDAVDGFKTSSENIDLFID